MLFEDEECNKKKKNIALKVTNVKDMKLTNEDCKSTSDEGMNIIFKEFLRHEIQTLKF